MLWIRCKNIWSDSEYAFDVRDFWELRDGDYLTITNRLADLPPGFELHPTEVQNTLVRDMMRRLESGYEPDPPFEAPNLWRVRAGDRLVWVGERRGGPPANDGVLSVPEFRESALVVGESNQPRDLFDFFGAPAQEKASPEAAARLRAGFLAAVALGTPRNLSTKWALG